MTEPIAVILARMISGAHHRMKLAENAKDQSRYAYHKGASDALEALEKQLHE